MDYHLFGKTVGMLRKQQGITQAKLCEGIIEPDAMSKVERGVHGISKEKMDLLLGRLGYVAKRFFPYPLSVDELNVFVLRDKLNNLDESIDSDKMASLINEIESSHELFKEGLHRQFLLKCKALLLKKEGEAKESKKMLDEAIKITLPHFKENLVNKYLLANDDMEIIVMMAQIAYEEGHCDSAIILLRKLAESVETYYVDEYEKARSLTFVLYSLSKYLGLMGRFDEAVSACEKAVNAGVKNKAYGFLHLLKFNQAYCLYYHDKRRINEVKELLFEAYYTCKAYGELHVAEEIKINTKKLFQIDISADFTSSLKSNPEEHKKG